MAIEKVELMHECFPKYLRMGTAIIKEVKETEKKNSRKELKWKVKRTRNEEITIKAQL